LLRRNKIKTENIEGIKYLMRAELEVFPAMKIQAVAFWVNITT
jgi:hypothetical protein